MLVEHLYFSVRIYDGYATYLRVKILPPVSFASFLIFIKMEFGFQGIVLPHACSVFIYLFIFLHSLCPVFVISLGMLSILFEFDCPDWVFLRRL